MKKTRSIHLFSLSPILAGLIFLCLTSGKLDEPSQLEISEQHFAWKLSDPKSSEAKVSEPQSSKPDVTEPKSSKAQASASSLDAQDQDPFYPFTNRYLEIKPEALHVLFEKDESEKKELLLAFDINDDRIEIKNLDEQAFHDLDLLIDPSPISKEAASSKPNDGQALFLGRATLTQESFHFEISSALAHMNDTDFPELLQQLPRETHFFKVEIHPDRLTLISIPDEGLELKEIQMDQLYLGRTLHEATLIYGSEFLNRRAKSQAFLQTWGQKETRFFYNSSPRIQEPWVPMILPGEERRSSIKKMNTDEKGAASTYFSTAPSAEDTQSNEAEESNGRPQRPSTSPNEPSSNIEKPVETSPPTRQTSEERTPEETEPKETPAPSSPVTPTENPSNKEYKDYLKLGQSLYPNAHFYFASVEEGLAFAKAKVKERDDEIDLFNHLGSVEEQENYVWTSFMKTHGYTGYTGETYRYGTKDDPKEAYALWFTTS